MYDFNFYGYTNVDIQIQCWVFDYMNDTNTPFMNYIKMFEELISLGILHDPLGVLTDAYSY